MSDLEECLAALLFEIRMAKTRDELETIGDNLRLGRAIILSALDRAEDVLRPLADDAQLAAKLDPEYRAALVLLGPTTQETKAAIAQLCDRFLEQCL